MSSDDTASDRDIDLVLVVGAGASVNFGVGGKPLALMKDWSDRLLDGLFSAGVHERLTGLSRGMSGPEFEEALGRFLKQVEAFALIEGLIEPSAGPGNLARATELMSWYQETRQELSRVIDLIRNSVYEQFGDDKTDEVAASEAYAELLGRVGLTRESTIVCATTNYDSILERALSRLGVSVDSGESPGLGGAWTVKATRLLEALPRDCPVIHLHGKLGWYRRVEDRTVQVMSGQPQAGFGVPIVMLPDPEKRYDDDDVISTLWNEFERALTRARIVLVLGHSLNDTFLVESLQRNVASPTRFGITVLADDDGNAEDDRRLGELMGMFPDAKMIPMRFGDDPDFGDGGLGALAEGR